MIDNNQDFSNEKEHYGVRGLDNYQPYYQSGERACHRLTGEEREEHLKRVQEARQKLLSFKK